jgi:hypothetical protein
MTGLRRIQKWSLWIVFLSLAACAHSEPLRSSLPDAPVPFDRAWRAALDTSLNYYDQIAVNDPESGFFQTTWTTHKVGLIIGSPVRRSRLVGQVTNKDPFRLTLTLEQEAFSLELGRWVTESPDATYFSQVVQDFSSKLQR